MSDKRQLNFREVEAWAALVAGFHARTGRNPDQVETDALIELARDMARTAGLRAPGTRLH